MLKEERTVAEIGSEYGVHVTMLHAWRREFLKKAPAVFEDKRKRLVEQSQAIWLPIYTNRSASKRSNSIFHPEGVLRDKGCLRQIEPETRKRAIRMKDSDLSIRRQCGLLNLTRSSLYYARQPENQENIAIMAAIDRQATEAPCYGILKMTEILKQNGFKVNHKRVRRLMRLMGLMAIYQKPNTSKKHPQHAVYPYLLRNLSVERSNQVWATDITYIPICWRMGLCI